MHKNYVFRGVKRLMILRIISEGGIHGSEVQKKLAEKYGLEVPKPVVYMILRKMEDDGLIVSWWETPSSGPVKRIYKVTDFGYEWMVKSIEDLKKLRKVVDDLIKELSSLKKLEAK
ncbi:MAG: PadR family transcriptional regulator [Candidatus Njordarchaeia archaeon]